MFLSGLRVFLLHCNHYLYRFPSQIYFKSKPNLQHWHQVLCLQTSYCCFLLKLGYRRSCIGLWVSTLAPGTGEPESITPVSGRCLGCLVWRGGGARPPSPSCLWWTICLFISICSHGCGRIYKRICLLVCLLGCWQERHIWIPPMPRIQISFACPSCRAGVWQSGRSASAYTGCA